MHELHKMCATEKLKGGGLNQIGRVDEDLP